MRSFLIRATRTFLQGFIGATVTVGVLNQISETGVLPGWPVWQQLLIAASAAGGMGLLSFVQNWLEDNRNWNVPKG